MGNDTLQINGVNYRIEINMNSAENWERLSGKKMGQFEMEAAESSKHGGVNTRAMLLWLFCAIIEGEELEGRAFELDFLEFKRMLKPSIMTQFAPIFLKQYIGGAAGHKEDVTSEKNKKQNPIRKFINSRLMKWIIVISLLACVALYVTKFY